MVKMKITKIKKQKRRKNRYNLYVDGEFFEGVDENTVVKLNLYKGKVVEKGDLERIRKVEIEEKLHDKVLRLISRFPKTEKELKDYILKKGYSKEISQKEINRLKEYDLIDDDNYVENYVKSNRKYSIRMLKNKLYKKGVPGKIIEKHLSVEDIQKKELKILKKLAKKKFKRVDTLGEKEQKEKVFAYLARKGFNFDDINKIVKKILRDKRSSNEN